LLAEEHDRSEAVSRALFRGFFEQGRDIGNLEVLTSLAAGEGFDPAETRRYLDSDRHRNTVRARQAEVQGAGLNGVPGVVFNGRYAVMGVQEPEVLIAAMDRALFEELDSERALIH
jgi:predicted DsbA family dithiol-disulfide isomerase